MRRALLVVLVRALVLGASLGLLFVLAPLAGSAAPSGRTLLAAWALGAAWFGAIAGACAVVEHAWPHRGAQGHDLVAGLLCLLGGALASVAVFVQASYARDALLGADGPLQFERALRAAHPAQAVGGAVVGAVLGVGAVARRRRCAPTAVFGMSCLAALVALLGLGGVLGAPSPPDLCVCGWSVALLVGGGSAVLVMFADEVAARLAPPADPGRLP